MSLKFTTHINIDSDSTYHFIVYLRHGEEHRMNGPAGVWGDGYRVYFRYGVLIWEDL